MPLMFDPLEVDYDDWRDAAACKDVDPELFFPSTPTSPLLREADAKRICTGCRVRRECLDYAVASHQRTGIWGGLTPAERQLVSDGRPLPSGYQFEISPDGLTVGPTDFKVVEAIRPKIHALIEVLAEVPEEIFKLHPREFEELNAELLARRGFDVELTQGSRDGGVDIFARKTDELGDDLLFLVQCKRYTHPNRVGAPTVRDLAGVISSCRATGGAIVTSSFFTKSAKAFADTLPHQIALRDNDALQEWIRRAVAEQQCG